jgi:hypothetical protein
LFILDSTLITLCLSLFVKIDLFQWLNHPFLLDNAPPGQTQLDQFYYLFWTALNGFNTDNYLNGGLL